MANVRLDDKTLVEIADKIREKTGETQSYKPSEMPDAIDRIQATNMVIEPKEITKNGVYEAPEGINGYNPITVNVLPNVTSIDITQNGIYTATDVDGYNEIKVEVEGVPTDEELTFTGDCSYCFKGGKLDWFIDKYGDRITTRDITTSTYMFDYSTLEEIPFELNFDPDYGPIEIRETFRGMHNLKVCPKINTVLVKTTNNLFDDCYDIREINIDNIDWSYIEGLTSSSSGSVSNMFDACYSLRRLPTNLTAGNKYATSYSSSLYYYMTCQCRALDEIIDLPVCQYVNGMSNNMFRSTFNDCSRLKNLTFETNEDGTPQKANWKNQVIDLSLYVGYVETGATGSYDFMMSNNPVVNYNSGITDDKFVYNDETYQALKDDPDWFAMAYRSIGQWRNNGTDYSRYNHDSAVATINSLPDTSAYGSNTIKFTGAAGARTDGGAINTLTEEEIAVAAAKGWTVTLV